jgi:hypothetical protein
MNATSRLVPSAISALSVHGPVGDRLTLGELVALVTSGRWLMQVALVGPAELVELVGRVGAVVVHSSR